MSLPLCIGPADAPSRASTRGLPIWGLPLLRRAEPVGTKIPLHGAGGRRPPFAKGWAAGWVAPAPRTLRGDRLCGLFWGGPPALLLSGAGFGTDCERREGLGIVDGWCPSTPLQAPRRPHSFALPVGPCGRRERGRILRPVSCVVFQIGISRYQIWVPGSVVPQGSYSGPFV